GPDEAASHSYVDDVALRLFRTYEERLRAANAVDFEDLILLVARLLAETPEGDKIRRRFDYVLVDEFQDTNATQYRFLRELVAAHGNLCVVGDADQSIYRGRGRAGHLALARGRRPQHPPFSPRLPGRRGRQARTELPVQRANRRRSARRHLPLAKAPAEGALDRQSPRTR